jgi:hypothetical protein
MAAWRHSYTISNARYCLYEFSEFVGQKFALMEEKTVLATFLRKFHIESMETVEQCHPLSELILKPLNGFKVKISTRRQYARRQSTFSIGDEAIYG